uniref:DUF1080 domain-containing protein n=1 Tax=Schlesneria paludicola TaxID=360056 RepID=A0A7C4LNR5_9PLAN
MKHCQRLLGIVWWGLMGACSVGAAEPAANVFERPLFEGESLAGWIVENGAEVDFVDGCLRLKAGNGWLRSVEEFRDFSLHVEWQALQAQDYDAGIYIRTAKTGVPFPSPSYQINLLEGKEGNIGNLLGATSKGLIKPQGEWNTFDMRVLGDAVSLEINGRPAYTVAGLQARQGHIGFQIEVPKGGQFLIRNVRLVEWGYRPLFNGRDLSGWVGEGGPMEACWRVEDGCLVCTGAKGPWLRSLEEFDDFHLRLDYLVSAGGNSGIYVRVPRNGNHHRASEQEPPAGFEVQVLDDAAPQYAALKPYQYSASVYDICGAAPRVSRPPGEWNTLEILCRGQHVTTRHNGVTVVDARVEEFPLLSLRQTKGYLGLQNHSTVVKFRNLRIGPAFE